MAQLLLDEAMVAYASSDWNYNTFNFPPEGTGPRSYVRKAPEIERPITVQEFVDGALRNASPVKNTRVLIDVNLGVPEVAGLSSTTPLVTQKKYTDLPAGLTPASNLPDCTKLG